MITRQFPVTVVRSGGKRVSIQITCTLSYDAENDPFAVQAIFSADGEEDRVWAFSRELLVRGSTSLARVGLGDVRLNLMNNSAQTVLLCLRNDDGHADLALPYSEVFDFLNETDDAALQGIECIDSLIDEAIEEILSS